ncbi:unnamed protein product, partial [Tenebrio molitor]
TKTIFGAPSSVYKHYYVQSALCYIDLRSAGCALSSKSTWPPKLNCIKILSTLRRTKITTLYWLFSGAYH